MSFKHHLLHYTILLVILVTGFGLFVRYQHHSVQQLWIVLAATLGYILWGVTHHAIERRLTWEVVSEYLLVGCVVVLAFGLVLGV